MLKQLAILNILFLSVVAPVMAQQEASTENSEGIRYISDDLFTFLHAGPGRNYRILGSVLAGSKVVQLQIDADKNFVEVIDDKQRTGWVDATYITSTQSVRTLVPELQQNLRVTTQELDQALQQTELLNQQIADLTSQNQQLKSQVAEVRSQSDNLQSELATKDQSAQMEWFARGGIIAIISIILGVIITYLPKKRRRNDQWM
jgi:SH3 domain protein